MRCAERLCAFSKKVWQVLLVTISHGGNVLHVGPNYAPCSKLVWVVVGRRFSLQCVNEVVPFWAPQLWLECVCSSWDPPLILRLGILLWKRFPGLVHGGCCSVDLHFFLLGGSGNMTLLTLTLKTICQSLSHCSRVSRYDVSVTETVLL